MVSTRTLLATVALVATSSFARVSNMSAPASVAAGQNFTAVLYTEGYIQNWDDFGVIWGFVPSTFDDCNDCLGDLLSYDNLYNNPLVSSHIGNTTFSVPVPTGMSGTGTLVAAVPHLVGASGENGINYFNQSITIT